MISIDDHPPPDPSSSSHHPHDHQQQQQQQIPHDLKVSDIDLKSPDADLDDTNNQLPNFSIRDYVFGLRSKDVACNWPFSPTSFQLCLKHGVKNLLPPFQSLDLLRDNSSVNRLRNEETVSSFDEKPRNDQFKSNCEQVSGSVTRTTNSSCSKRNNNVSQFHFQEDLLHTKSKEKNTENIRKSKLVMRLNPSVEQVEEIAMASKICPVCKIFSSSSNTTLNAHIDQCLTGEGTMKWTHDNPKVTVKHRVKPRKTRLMVEIYKTAPHCTIEELDRRNGTSWATNSNFPAQEFQFDQGEEEEEKEKDEEKQEPRTTTINREVADNEGDVYIDTDGTKVRILSVPKSGSLDNNHGNQKLIRGSKFCIGKKKFKSHLHNQKHHKYLKLSPNVKELCSPKPQARSGHKEDVSNCSKDEQLKKPVNNPLSDLGIVRPPWACSKRTNLTKKFTGKRKHTKNLLIESDHKSSSQCDLGTSPPLSSDDVALSQSRKKTRTSSPLMVELRKESTSMHDDSESSPDSSSPSENSDHTRTKGTKFLRKRKSSSVIGSKEETTSNEEEESSVGVETADHVDEHALHDAQSLLPNLQQVSHVVAPPNFTGLSNSFDPEFSKCVELYQEQLLCSTNRAPDVEEKHDFIFLEDDPIPIPGPPGSFLPPSPGGDMVSEDQLQTNSSSTTTTTTRMPSTDQNNHNDTMDRDSNSMSNSPVSTVSNPSLARSDSRSTSVVQDDKKSFPTSFKNDQPCCCSRKDTAFSYNQESNKSSTPTSFNLIRSETAIFPTMKKLPVYNDHNNNDSVASPPKPVLRLMGKNLTVVKTDDDDDASQSSQQFRPPPQPPVIFSRYQNGSEPQRFNVYPPVNMTSHGGFMASVDRYGHAGHYLGQCLPQARSHHGHNRNEIIVIDNDDLPENESDDSMRNKTLRRNHGQMNPLYTMYQAQSSGHMYSGGGGGGSTVFRGGSFNGDLGKWNVGSSSSSSLSSPSLATSHMRSSTSYYPSSYP